MPFVDTPNVVMAEIVAQMDGQLIENRVMVDVFHQPTAVDLQNVQDVVLSFCNLRYAALLPTECVITEIKCTSLDARDRIQDIAAVNIPGAVTGGAMPNEVTYCVSLKSSQIGRSARGRFYVLGIAKVNVGTQNRVGATYRTAIQDALTFLKDSLQNAAYRLVIVSYRTNNAPRPGGPVYFVVQSCTTTDDVVDSQRRRRPGVGT
jgi:hypothetical protein